MKDRFRFVFGVISLMLLLLTSNDVMGQKQTANSAVNKVPPAFLAVKGHWADSVFKSLTPNERIAQLFMVAAYSDKDAAHVETINKLVHDYKIGGLIFFKGTPSKQALLTNFYQRQAKTPLLIAIDGEWGLSMRLDSTLIYPRQMSLGAIQNEQLVYEMGQQIAEQCTRMGIHINFAPVIDVNNNAKNPVINNRSFGENKKNVTKLGLAYMKGMQDKRIIACGKHFPGHGDTDMDSHLALPKIDHSYKRLDTLELYPFKELINSGLASIMVAHLYIPSLDKTHNLASTLSSKIVNGLLKDSLGFEGLVFTDALNMKGVSSHYPPGEVDVKAILAGNDILLFPEDVPIGIKMIKEAIAQGKITQADIDARCMKILKAKEWANLDHYQPIDLTNLTDDLLQIKYHALNRQLTKASLTLIKNEAHTLPLKNLDQKKTIYLNIGGTENNVFRETMKLYASVDMLQIPRSLSSKEENDLIKGCAKYDQVIIGFHRTNNDPTRNFGVTIQSIEIHEELSKQQDVISVIFGNPYVLHRFEGAEATTAMVVAYQDNDLTQEAAAQLIFGGILPIGKLPVSGSEYFPAGTGLSYPEKIRLSHVLPEEIGIKSSDLLAVDSIAMEGIKIGAYPGCQILGIKDGEVFYNRAFGFHTYENARAVKTSDLYDLASITKIAASTLAMIKLQELGLMDISKALHDYIPEIVDSTPYSNMVIKAMMSHQAGLAPWIPFHAKSMIQGELDPSIYSRDSSAKFPYRVAQGIYIRTDYDTTILRQITDKELQAKEYKYSDLGYFFIKKMVEKITNKRLDVYLNELVYRPMGLQNLGYNPLQRMDKERIAPTEDDKVYRKQLVWGDVHDQSAAMLGGVGGHAGLFSNALDLGTLMYMLINDGKYGGKQILDKETIAAFTSCQYCSSNRRGAGFDRPVPSLDGGPTCNKVGLSSFGHSGFTGTITWADPEKGIVYVFLSNRIYPNAENPLLLSQGIRTQIQAALYRAAGY